MHKLLEHQIRRSFGELDKLPDEVKPLMAIIDQAYAQADDDRRLLEHSLDITSQELLERYEKLASEMSERVRLERTLRGNQEQLEIRVAERTAELSQANEELARSRDKALDLARVKADFLANMSHELRTPLNAVLGMTGLLLDTRLDWRQRDYAQTVHQAGDALLSLINDILDFSKIEAGKLALEVVAFDPREIVDEAVQLVAHSARTKGITLIAECALGVPSAVRGDPGRLRQVLLNLLGNAVKFTAQGRVTIRLRAEGADLVFDVRDTGIGIAPDIIPALFTAFSQADTTMTRRFGGTGLGLAICRRLVDLFGGAISVSSVIGQGSVFSVKVPLPSCADTAVAAPLAGLRVSIAASDPELLASYREVLLHAGAEVADGGKIAACIVDLPDEEFNGRATSESERGLPLVRLVGVESALTKNGALLKPVRRSALVGAVLAAVPGQKRKEVADIGARPAPSARLKVLLVEDNSVNQKVALLMLRSLGHDADAVANGLEAVEASARIRYDLILMDCQMPEMDGYEAARVIRRREKDGEHIPIIAMTAHALEGDRQQCLDAGMDDYLAKPVRSDELAVVLRQGQSALDPARFAELKQLAEEGDPGLLQELAVGFERDLKIRVAELKEAVAAGKPERVHRLAHAIGGSASSVGMFELEGACRALESLARSGDISHADKAVGEVVSQSRRATASLSAFRRLHRGECVHEHD